MVEAELGLLEVEVEGAAGDPLELGEAMLGEGPEALDAVDVVRAHGELVGAMVDTKMPGIAEIDQAVITAPAVGMDHGIEWDFSGNRCSAVSLDMRT